MENHCIFCDIISGRIPAEPVYENEWVFAFRDLHPQAPSHLLLIPRLHIPTLEDLEDHQKELAGELLLAVRQVARIAGIDQTGYRSLINCRADGGQEVQHLHLHILGGRRMTWPPG